MVRRVALTYFESLFLDFKYCDILCFGGDTVCSNNGYISLSVPNINKLNNLIPRVTDVNERYLLKSVLAAKR